MAHNSIPEASAPGVDSDRARAETVERLFREHNRALVQYLALRLHSVQEAKEIAQEAYVRLLQLDREGAEGFLKNYLYRVATNLAIDRIRRRGYQARHEQAALSESDSYLNTPERAMVAGEQFEKLFAALDELPAKYRDALLLYRFDGLDQQTIAARLNVNARTVRDYISYALKYCQERIDGATREQAKDSIRP